MSDLFSVAGKVAIVTGAMGQLGRQFCAALAEGGAHVVALDRNIDLAAAEKAFPKLHSKMLFLDGDVTKRPSLENALAAVVEKFGAPEVLVNNAGLDSPPGAPAAE